MSITVHDTHYFTDGYGLVEGDRIQVGTSPPVLVTDVIRNANTIIIDRKISWQDGNKVSYPYCGAGPDIGAIEYHPIADFDGQCDA